MRHEIRLRVESLERRIALATLLHSLFPDPTGPQQSSFFGASIATNSTYRVVGANLSDVAGITDVGQAFIYDVATNNLVATLNNPSPNSGDNFGTVAVSGNIVVVGALQDDTGATDAGSAYVYDLSSKMPTTPILTLNNPTPADSDVFGRSVAVSGNYVVVGAAQDDTFITDAGSAYVYDLTSKTPTIPIVTLNNPTPADSDNFGFAVAIAGNYVVVGAYRDDTGTTDAGSAYVYDLTGKTPTTPIVTLNNPTPAAFDYFGYSVAISGNYVVVGAYQDDTGTTDAGSAYVYDLTSKTPSVPVTILNDPTPVSGSDNFGISVAASGKYVVVGAYQDDTGASDDGSAYVYDVSSMTPALPILTLNNPSPTDGDEFGAAVAVSGSSVMIGAIFDDVGETDTGSVYVYDVNSMTPTAPILALNNPTPAHSDAFGSVAVSGNLVVVGALQDDTGAIGAGCAYVYDLAGVAPATPVLKLNNPTPADFDNFGIRVAISGNCIVVGAFRDDTGAKDAGSAYVYDLSSATPTIPVVTLNNPAPTISDFFGNSVAVSGKYVVVGAYQDDAGASNAGSAYVYDVSSMTPATPIFVLNNPSPASGDFFGFSVAVSGKYVVVGVYNDDTGASNAGLAYVYDISSKTPTTPIATLTNPSPAVNDLFGYSVAASGNIVIVGAYLDDEGATDAGSAYVYDLSSATPSIAIATLNNPSPNAGDNFATSVAAAGNFVVAGAIRDDPGATDAGSAYVYDLNSKTPTTPFTVINNPTPANFDFFGSSVAASENVVVVGASSDSDQNVGQGSARVYSVRTQVAAVQVNDGSAQRSMVTSLKVTFDSPLSFVGKASDAFTLVQLTTMQSVNLAASVDASNRSVTLTFTGGSVNGTSLADGLYKLTVLANQIVGGEFDGNGDGTFGDNYVLTGSATVAPKLFRFFGDSNGDGFVNSTDFASFRSFFGLSNSIFDFNGDGQTNSSDFADFRQRFGTMV